MRSGMNLDTPMQDSYSRSSAKSSAMKMPEKIPRTDDSFKMTPIQLQMSQESMESRQAAFFIAFPFGLSLSSVE